MAITSSIREHINKFDLTSLFIEELGWEHLDENEHQIPVNGTTYKLQPVAHKRAFKVFLCKANAAIPELPVRMKIEREITKHAHEHLIVFVDSLQTTQRWQWAKREGGKRVAVREETWTRGQSGERLAQKLHELTFRIEDEHGADIIVVTGKVKKAFDVEKVTKKFYDLFKKEHDGLLAFLKGIPDDELARWYVSVLLNRLMFIYFIQKKGFLNGDADYLRNLLTKSIQNGDDHFYRDYLCPLFFAGFATKEHSATFVKTFGSIPYLNGGIFQKHQIETLHGNTIRVPDRAFVQLFEFFEGYQWRLDERPLKDDNEINPDVLGYIFEKYVNQKQMGAYYTKEDITGYIGRNTIIPRLFDMARVRCKVAFEGDNAVWQLLRNDPDRYIYDAVKKGFDLPLPPEVAVGLDDIPKRTEWNKPAPEEYALPTEIWREVVARRKRYAEVRAKLAAGEVREISDLITHNLDIERFAQDVIETSEGPELVRAYWRSIVGKVPERSNENFEQGISILDPTCGSGAFLFAALNILEPLYEACLNRMEALVSESDSIATLGNKQAERYSDFRKILKQVEEHPNRRYFIYKSIIVGNLFGVDIMEEATEICKLRLFLKLAAQVDDVSRMEPLPDIDFNIRAGNTLVGFATREEVTAAITEAGSGQLKAIFDTDEERLRRIETKADDIDHLFLAFRQQQTAIGGEVSQADKVVLQGRLGDLAAELNEYLARQYGVDPKRVRKYGAWTKSHQPFHWFVEFYGILSRGGFDVVIGNPPYVEYKEIKGKYSVLHYETVACGDLYANVCERSYRLMQMHGMTGLIVPISIFGTDGFMPLQKLTLMTLSSLWISCFANRPTQLFDGAQKRLTIVVGKRNQIDVQKIFTTSYIRWKKEERENLFPTRICYVARDTYYQVFPGSLEKIGSEIENSAFHRMIKSRKLLAASVTQTGKNRLYYTRKFGYFLAFLNFIPEIENATTGQSQLPSELKDLSFSSSDAMHVAIAGLTSTSFFWFWNVLSDCRNLNRRDVLAFPMSPDHGLRKQSDDFVLLAKNYLKQLRQTSKKMIKSGLILETFDYASCKPAIDKIDFHLARHFEFTDEELDFIVNYDIKYRMSIDRGNEE